MENSFDSPQDKKKLLNRVARIEGQVRGIERMIEEGTYCIDLVNQIRSASRALEGLGAEIMQRHLESCVREAIASEDPYAGKDKIEEFMETVNRFLKK